MNTWTNEELNSVSARFGHELMVAESTEGVFAFLYGLVRLYRPRIAVELGTHVGCSSVFIAQALRDNRSGSFVGYEVNEEHVGQASARLLRAGFTEPSQYSIKRADVYSLPDGSIPCDFAFIDIEPKSEYLAAFRKLAMPPGSLIVCHDTGYDPVVFEVATALEKEGWRFLNIPRERGVLVGIKEGER